MNGANIERAIRIFGDFKVPENITPALITKVLSFLGLESRVMDITAFIDAFARARTDNPNLTVKDALELPEISSLMSAAMRQTLIASCDCGLTFEVVSGVTKACPRCHANIA